MFDSRDENQRDKGSSNECAAKFSADDLSGGGYTINAGELEHRLISVG